MSETDSRRSGPIRHFSELIVYRRAFGLGVRIFENSRTRPSEGKYSLIDQIRRSSRSIGANISEAWAKRRYSAHFVSKLTDADAEAHETEHWLGCAFKHGYLSQVQFDELRNDLSEIGKMLGSMMAKPESFGLKSGK